MAAVDLSNGCRRYVGKTCLVTASTQGIGLAIAARFAAEGGRVVLSSRKEKGVEKAVKLLRAIPNVKADDIFGQVCHVDNEKDRQALLAATKAKFGTIDVLVLNAAASSWTGLTMDTPASAFDKIFATNVRSTFLFAKDAVPFMTPCTFPTKASTFAPNILLVGSFAGYNPTAPIGIYGVTKTAMIGLMKSMSTDLAPKGIRVNLVAPGVIRTKFSTLLVDAIESKKDELANELMSQCVMKRVGEASEIAGVAAFLCSADASYISGESLVAAGGSPKL